MVGGVSLNGGRKKRKSRKPRKSKKHNKIYKKMI